MAERLDWRAIFYLISGASALWFIGMVFLVHDHPRENPRHMQIFVMVFCLVA